jgi:pilus assembly protein CpaC
VTFRTRVPFASIFAWTLAVGLPCSLDAQKQAAAPASTAASSSSVEFNNQDSASDLSLSIGKSILLDLTKPAVRISIGSADVAEATAVSPTEVMVNGKAIGETSLIVWERGGGRQFYNVDVHASRTVSNDKLAAVRRQLALELPGQNVHLTSERLNAESELFFLRGTVKDLASSQRAVQIAQTMGKTVNLLNVEVPEAPVQILLKVRFASVDRTVTKNLCWNLFSTGATNTIGSVGTQACSPPTITIPTAGTPVSAAISSGLDLFLFRQDLNLGATIQALETKGLAEVLAEPNVMAENGREASFLAGGEFPYPVLQSVTSGSGGITIQFKEYGIRLNFIPTITPRGTIRLQVAPEVSALDFADGLTISGFTVPAVTVRRVRTEVELNNGQSFALGGLLDNSETETFSKVPFLGDIPILGKLFQSITRTKQNTELIVLVTPEIIGPIPANAALPQLKYPAPFLPPNSGIPMTNPGPEVTGPVVQPKAPGPTIPVETLIQSMQPEQPLIIDSGAIQGSGNYGGGTPQQQAAPALPNANPQ